MYIDRCVEAITAKIKDCRNVDSARVTTVTFIVLERENGRRKHVVWRAKASPVLTIDQWLVGPCIKVSLNPRTD